MRIEAALFTGLLGDVAGDSSSCATANTMFPIAGAVTGRFSHAKLVGLTTTDELITNTDGLRVGNTKSEIDRVLGSAARITDGLSVYNDGTRGEISFEFGPDERAIEMTVGARTCDKDA
jgi:hypothetical protein